MRGRKSPWYASPYTGLFASCGVVPTQVQDPAVFAWAGVLPRWGGNRMDLPVGGVGWTLSAGEGAGVGEAIERWRSRPEPGDLFVETTFADWPLEEPAVPPEDWVLFHPHQYGLPGFPFQPFTTSSVSRWYPCRDVRTGEPYWVPGWQLFLEPDPGVSFGPSLSTGLAAGRGRDPVLLRALQEVVERDALVGAWWERYPLEEHDGNEILAQLPACQSAQLRRPNLGYRCYRLVTPFSAHVTLVTLEGEDRDGWLFSTGSACRETRLASWQKSFLEAVQGRHYVRHLKGSRGTWPDPPEDFAGHALYYTLHPNSLPQTILRRASSATLEGKDLLERLPALLERLGNKQRVLFRLLTPGAVIPEMDWRVVRVVVPGLQPLHGHHTLPFLGGPLGADLIKKWPAVLPHPFA